MAVSTLQKVVISISASLVAAIVVAISLGIITPRLDKGTSQETNLSSLPARSLPRLPRNAATELYVAEIISGNSTEPKIIARSYLGLPWEAVHPGGDGVLPEGDYHIRHIPVPPQNVNPSTEALAARLLQQATFGGNKAEIKRISEVYGRNFGQWIQDQFRLTPTSVRAYYRRRVNPRRLVTVNVTREIAAETRLCDLDTRWHQYVFESRDRSKTLVVRTDELPGTFTLRVNGQIRGQVTNFLGQPWPGTKITALNGIFPATLRICQVDQMIGGRVVFSRNMTSCTVPASQVSWINPAINITIAGAPIQKLGQGDLLFPVVGRGGAYVLKSRAGRCANLSDADGNSFVQQGNNTYRYDKRMRFISNTVESPATVGNSGNGTCPIITKSYLNRFNCVRRASCGKVVAFKSAPVPLNDTILRAWYTENRRYVYYFKNLRLEAPFDVSPCRSGSSRWMKVGNTKCPSPTTLDKRTHDLIAGALASSPDPNPYVRDITLSGSGCTASKETIGAQIDAGGLCWQHVHPDYYSVRDATRMTEIHAGNAIAMQGGKPNPIMKWAQNGLTYLNFPASHPLQRWAERRQTLPLIGRYGDVVDFQLLSSELQSEQIAVRVGALRNLPDGAESPEACGSPGEVENLPDLGNHYVAYTQDMDLSESVQQLEYEIPVFEDYMYVINNVAIFGADQLRQRVAWTLSNIIVAASTNIGFGEYPEAWLSFYDIFVRNAAGSFLDIMRDVSFHPLMAHYLTYIRNRAFAVTRSFPDENYAREIMQLFSVGLWKLNDDGSQKLDGKGDPIPTYTNEDILDFARIWTGFDLRASRNNLGDARNGATSANLVDPMQIRPGWRDRFPKAKLDSGHIGDQYPLCDELPPQSFLHEGARFEFTGDLSVEGDLLDQENKATIGRRGRLTPVPAESALHSILCAPRSTDGKCTFPVNVVLTSNLPCNGPQECGAGRVRVIKVIDPVAKVHKYYTHIPPPCVRLTFFEDGHLLRRATNRAQCADPKTAVGAPVCCNSTDLTRSIHRFGSECLFAAETTDLNTARQRCNKLGLTLCSGAIRERSTINNTCADDLYMWTSASCSVQIQVYPFGEIGIVDPNATQFFTVAKNSLNNVFRPRWNQNSYPVATAGRCPASCSFESTSDGPTCLCNITVTNAPIFRKISDFIPLAGSGAAGNIASRAFIGASKPSQFTVGTYTRCTHRNCTAMKDVSVWLHSSDKNGLLSEKTIFELPPYRAGRGNRYLLNRISTVKVANSFSFRNPPHFTPLLGEQNDANRDYLSDNLWVNQAENEVNALLDHLFEHSNTAPFVCYRLIQHMVTSNPSPRYVQTVVNAFRSGAYGGIQFSGKYGDLSAAVYAMLMDREARTPILDADPSFGMIRDPLIKLYHLMRSLEYKSTRGREVAFSNLAGRIGVQALRSPSVFNFYTPEYQPAGPISRAGLVAPQAQISTTPNLLGFLNGATSLVDNGLTNCNDGFAVGQSRPNCSLAGADGELNYTPPPNATAAQIVEELDLLLTSKRLNVTTKQYFVREYNLALNTTKSATTALKTLIKLFLATLEFHTSTLNIPTKEVRKPQSKGTSSGRKFKAIIVVFESGGCDSYNKIVPHSNCPARDLYAEYQSVRQGAAINKTRLLPVNLPAGSQPCNTFGIHPSMPRQHALFNQKEQIFLANIGALIQPITKSDFNSQRAKVPPSLFAHNIMSRSAQNVHAQNANAQGVLGRIFDTLVEGPKPYKSALFSFSGQVKMVQGSLPADMVSANNGVSRFRLYNSMKNAFGNLTQYVSSSPFAETYADAISNSLQNSEYVAGLIQNTTLSTNFTTSGFNQQLQMTAKLIKSLSRQVGVERATFFTERGGYDTHATFDLSPMFSDIDNGLGNFAAEMKAQGLWNDVVVVSISDFARTLQSNGKGTDHAWGGIHILAGGQVKGGQILGSYPDRLTDDSNLSLGRGRLIPTLPFESIWNGIASWFGVPKEKIPYVVPNAVNFNSSYLFTRDQLFKPDTAQPKKAGATFNQPHKVKKDN